MILWREIFKEKSVHICFFEKYIQRHKDQTIVSGGRLEEVKNNGKFKTCHPKKWVHLQRARKVVSDNPGLVDFAMGLINSIINNGLVNFFEEFKLQKNREINLLIKTFWELVEMIFGIVMLASACPNGKL